MKTYSYEVDVVVGEYNVSHTVDEAASFDAGSDGRWLTFYAPGGGTLAVFAAHAVVAVVKDLDSVKDSEAAA